MKIQRRNYEPFFQIDSEELYKTGKFLNTHNLPEFSQETKYEQMSNGLETVIEGPHLPISRHHRTGLVEAIYRGMEPEDVMLSEKARYGFMDHMFLLTLASPTTELHLQPLFILKF